MTGSFTTSVRFQKGRFIFKGNSFFTFLTSEVALKGFGEVWWFLFFFLEGGEVFFLASDLLKKPEFCTCIMLKAEAG